jgi:uncharacterized protein YbjT (DUF2867 family)
VVAAVVVNAQAVATVAATKQPRTALLAGATGLLGRELLTLLLADSRYSTVHSVGRRAPALSHPKLVGHLLDFANPAQLAALPVADDVYIALGTTIKVAGSPAAFRAIDYDAVVALAQQNIAQAATKNIAKELRIGVVSAMGADAQSKVFYNQVKGQMEHAISQLGYASVSIARPSMLAGDRAALQQAARPAEQIGLALMTALRFAIPANYQAIEAAEVAAALHRMVTLGSIGVHIALSGQLRSLAHT